MPSIRIRMATWNLEFGKNVAPEQAAKALEPWRFDVVCFNEVPGGDWSAKAAEALGMRNSATGAISSANHKDKYRSILSGSPLSGITEIELSEGLWNPASSFRAETSFGGKRIAIHSLHLNSCQRELLDKALASEKIDAAFAMGDYNARLGSEHMNLLEKAGFRASWRDLDIDLETSFTYNAYDPKDSEGVIDHILYRASSGAKAVDGGIIEIEKPLSDHKPIWAEFEIPR